MGRRPAMALAVLLALAACDRPAQTGPAPTAAPSLATRIDDRTRAIHADAKVVESAPWFGHTGLPEETEREVPRYLRRELGALLGEPGAVRAEDLAYLGAFTEQGRVVHYWRMPGRAGDAPAFARVVASPESERVIGWGHRGPPAPPG